MEAKDLREQFEQETGNKVHEFLGMLYAKWLEQRLLLSSEVEKGENLPQFCQSTMKESHGVCLMPTNSCQQCKWTDTQALPDIPTPPVAEAEKEQYADTEADGIVFCGKCGQPNGK